MTLKWFFKYELPQFFDDAKESLFSRLILKVDQYDYIYDHFNEKLSLEEITKNWNSYLKFKLKTFGWNKKAINDFINWGKEGHNFKNLWFENGDISLQNFIGDVHYCSDRQSLDRLFRCNWMLHGVLDKAKNDKN
jgi:hypothetical protein